MNQEISVELIKKEEGGLFNLNKIIIKENGSETSYESSTPILFKYEEEKEIKTFVKNYLSQKNYNVHDSFIKLEYF